MSDASAVFLASDSPPRRNKRRIERRPSGAPASSLLSLLAVVSRGALLITTPGLRRGTNLPGRTAEAGVPTECSANGIPDAARSPRLPGALRVRHGPAVTT
ncbi:hypothetical protein MTO96_009815 [Rhipicephalus appendiculatus]